MGQRNLSSSDVAATAKYQVEREEVAMGFNWAYGLLRSWMVGFEVPLRMVTTRVQRTVDMQEPLQEARVSALSKVESESRVEALVQQQLEASGFDDVPSQSQTWEWGDINLLSQVGLLESTNWRWSFQQMLRFPTSRNPSFSDYVKSERDDGQLDLGLTSFTDYLYRRWTFGWRVGVVVQTADRLKTRTSNSAPADEVKRDLGDWVWSSLDGDYKLSRRWSTNLGYTYLNKGKDQISGASVKGTDQELHQSRLTITYQVTPFYVRGGVQSKWLMAGSYQQPWIGKNSTRAARAGVEFTTFF